MLPVTAASSQATQCGAASCPRLLQLRRPSMPAGAPPMWRVWTAASSASSFQLTPPLTPSCLAATAVKTAAACRRQSGRRAARCSATAAAVGTAWNRCAASCGGTPPALPCLGGQQWTLLREGCATALSQVRWRRCRHQVRVLPAEPAPSAFAKVGRKACRSHAELSCQPLDGIVC